jgi:hypothetical protein
MEPHRFKPALSVCGAKGALSSGLPVLLIVLASIGSVSSLEDQVTFRLTVQIHEAPLFSNFYLFYFANVELARGDDPVANRTAVVRIPKGEEQVQGISAYASNETHSLDYETEEDSEWITVRVTTDSSGFELRYYQVAQARVMSNDDQILDFRTAKVDNPLRGLTVAVNWPNWNYQIHKLLPEGAEMVMNPMFETDPYKSVSYYWYLSGLDAKERAPDEVSVRLRTAATVSRVTRNQSIAILAAVVCIPTAIFVALHPPKRGELEEREKRLREREKRFRITDERRRGRQIKRGRYKVK